MVHPAYGVNHVRASAGKPPIGRERELVAAERGIDAARRGGRAGLAVSGEPGIGKTRLLDEVCRRAEGAGLAVVRGRGSAFDRDQPFGLARDLLERLPTSKGALVAVDDAHWADRESLELLLGLLTGEPRLPVLVVVAFRPGQMGVPLRRMVDGVLRRLELGPLAEPEAGALLGPEVQGAALTELLHESGGNPRLLVEAARRRQTGAVPIGLIASLRLELTAVSPHAATLLDGAAVVGDPFDLDLAARAAGLPAAAALAALAELRRLGLVRPSGSGGSHAFRHPIVRRAIYASAGAGFKLSAHARAAAALAAAGASATARAAHVQHVAYPGDASAIRLFAAAADASPVAGDTARWLAAAVRLLPATAPAEERLALMIPLALALGTSGDADEGRDLLTQALPWIPPTGPLRGRVIAAIARLDHIAGRHGTARQLLEQALAGADAGAEVELSLVLELAVEEFLAARWCPLVAAATRAGALAEERGEALEAVAAAALEAIGRAHLGEVAAAQRLAAAAAQSLGELPDDEVARRIDALFLVQHAELTLIGAATDGTQALRGIAICRRTGQTPWLAALQCVTAGIHLTHGRLADAAAAAAEALDSASSHPFARAWALAVRSQARLLGGDLAAGVADGEAAVALLPPAPPMLALLVRSALAAALVEAGEGERARTVLLAGLGGPQAHVAGSVHHAAVYATLAAAELRCGDVPAASRWLRRAEAVGSTPVPDAVLGTARAALELAQGRPRRASELALREVERADAAGRVIDAARARILAGRALDAAGDRDQAVALLRQAHAELDARGVARYRDEAAHALRRLGQRMSRSGGRGSGGHGADVLSAREREIAELVARGLTNRQVAELLFLSVKTVETHLRHSFDKLGVSSRASLARTIAAEAA